MIQALLVDLDDTLLQNDVGRFIPAYFDLLARELAVFGPKDRILTAILAGTKAMLGNEDPERTLAQVFFGSFEEATGADPNAVAVALQRFYGEVYPQLETLTGRIEGAAPFLRSAIGNGLAVAVATNPLMVRSAIEHRLAWAGAPVTEFGYALITDVETFHFAKPRPAYFAEALAYLGRLPSEAAMVGNDVVEDLDPAASLGLTVFHVTATPADGRPSGDLGEASRWLAAQTHVEPPPINQPAALIARFEGQLAALLSGLRRVGEEALRRPLAGGGLAPLQVVCHLRDVDREVNLPRLKMFLEKDDPFLSSVDTDKWISERDYIHEEPQQAVRGFIAARKDVTVALRGLSAAEWRRKARHSLLGPITLGDWIAVLAEHDLRHIAPVVAPLGARSPARDSA
jgi:FMN phosphatase YigB (HAD superfamily)